MELLCKRCGSTSYVKHGFVRGLQRYRCKTCGFHFTATPKRGRSEATKALAVLLYSFGKASFRWLGKLLGVSGVDENILKKWYLIWRLLGNTTQNVFKNWPDFTGQAM